ncbi:hypothetical protein DF947_22085, partial [Pedobacter paludis]
MLLITILFCIAISGLDNVNKKAIPISENRLFFFWLSSPEIAIQKRIVMRSIIKSGYQKRTQKDYSLSFKHQIVFEI